MATTRRNPRQLLEAAPDPDPRRRRAPRFVPAATRAPRSRSPRRGTPLSTPRRRRSRTCASTVSHLQDCHPRLQFGDPMAGPGGGATSRNDGFTARATELVRWCAGCTVPSRLQCRHRISNSPLRPPRPGTPMVWADGSCASTGKPARCSSVCTSARSSRRSRSRFASRSNAWRRSRMPGSPEPARPTAPPSRAT